MGKILVTKIDKFDGGVQLDIRGKKSNGAQMVKNFDILSFPSSLKPYNSTEEGNDTQEREIQRFQYNSSTLYGLGVVEGTAFAKIYTKTDFTAGAWSTPSSSESGSGATTFNLFIGYKISGTFTLFGAKGGSAIWKCVPGSAFTETERSITYTTIRQGLVHSKDDILYIPYDNKIAKNNAGSWTDAALTLPNYLTIESVCEYGNYLAILASDGRKSVVYLWDRDTSLTTLSESIDLGYGYYAHLHEYEGALVAIGQVEKTLFAKAYSGSGFQTLAEVRTTSTADIFYGATNNLGSQKTRNRIYFLATVTIDGTAHQGTWSLGRSRGGELAFSLENTPNNDTAPTAVYAFHVEYISGVLYFFTAYNDGSEKQVSKTSESNLSFSASSLWESLVLDFSDASIKKKLHSVTVTHEALPAAGQVVVKYKVDAESSWTTIYTHTTDDSISHTAINIESSSAALPEFKELRLQITSTGGAVITGVKISAEITGKDILDI